MNLVIMQPYLFPYLGYVQLMALADTFVIYDDAQYIKGGWINRNRIMGHGAPHVVTVSLRGASANKMINQIEIGDNLHKLRRTLAQCYAKAPFVDEGLAYVDACFANEDRNLARFVGTTLEKLASLLDLDTKFLWSSDVSTGPDVSAEAKVLSMCQQLGASRYINSEGGKSLYNRDNFIEAGIELQFLEHIPTDYHQVRNRGPFEPRLSVIDALMNEGADGVKDMLGSYRLTP